MESHRPRNTESKHELGSCLCQLWLNCASVGCGEGNLRPHIDKVHNDFDANHDNVFVEAWYRTMMLTIMMSRHKEPVYSVAFSPCGKFLASGSFDKWDLGISSCSIDLSLKVCSHLEHSKRPTGSLVQGHWRHFWGSVKHWLCWFISYIIVATVMKLSAIMELIWNFVAGLLEQSRW